jgi:HPt (histidine-containing phosphotransfer) domain-containing protein
VSETPAIDAAAFANLLEMTGGDLAFVDELVDTYIEEGDRLVGALRAGATAGTPDALVMPAHSLKSSSLNLGALELGDRCRELEALARAGTMSDASDRVEAIETSFARARRDLLAMREDRLAEP